MTEEKKTTTKKTTKKGRKKNYINNADLLIELEKSRAQDKMTEKLGNMFKLLTKRYAEVPRFASYTYNDDMQAYALLVIVKYWRTFNPEKSNNPFAFFTQAIKRAFFQFDNNERQQRDIRDELLLKAGENPSFSYLDRHSNNDFEDNYTSNNDIVEYNYEGPNEEE